MFSKPRSLLDSFDEDGDIDPVQFFQYQRNQTEELEAEINDQMDNNYTEEPKRKSYPLKRKRSALLLYYDSDGEMCEMKPEQLLWYLMYVKNPDLENNKFHMRSRSCFRLPYANFLQFIQDACEGDWFSR